MSNIILPQEEEQPEKIALEYEATERDEEVFFLMYHMNFQPSEANALEENYRKWLIARFVAQKNGEREYVQQQRLMSQIGPNLKV